MNETNAGGVRRRFPFPFRITVADNAGTDGTWGEASDLTLRLPHVHAVHLEAKGRGRALKQVWSDPTADVVAYMDVDLAVGSRLYRQSDVVRGAKREFVSRSYNLLPKAGLGARFSDAQCGFKAVRTDVFRALAPHIEDTAWFFDTELLVLAQRNGLRIHEVPVDWVDDPDSRVDIVRTALDDLKGVRRMLHSTVTGRTRIAVPRQASTPQVPAARKSPEILPARAATSLDTLEYAS